MTRGRCLLLTRSKRNVINTKIFGVLKTFLCKILLEYVVHILIFTQFIYIQLYIYNIVVSTVLDQNPRLVILRKIRNFFNRVNKNVKETKGLQLYSLYQNKKINVYHEVFIL